VSQRNEQNDLVRSNSRGMHNDETNQRTTLIVSKLYTNSSSV